MGYSIDYKEILKMVSNSVLDMQVARDIVRKSGAIPGGAGGGAPGAPPVPVPIIDTFFPSADPAGFEFPVQSAGNFPARDADIPTIRLTWFTQARMVRVCSIPGIPDGPGQSGVTPVFTPMHEDESFVGGDVYWDEGGLTGGPVTRDITVDMMSTGLQVSPWVPLPQNFDYIGFDPYLGGITLTGLSLIGGFDIFNEGGARPDGQNMGVGRIQFQVR